MSVVTQSIDLKYEFAKEVLKNMIRGRTLVLSDEGIYGVLDEMREKYDLSDEMYDELRNYVSELWKLIEEKTDLAVIELYDGHGSVYFIVPKVVKSDGKLTDAIASLSLEDDSILLRLVARYLESCGIDAFAKSSRGGDAYPFVVIGEAWGVNFSKDYKDFDFNSGVGTIELCLDDVCIYEHLYYCNYVCNAHGVFKCADFTFEKEPR